MLSGTAAWKRSESMKSISARAPFALRAPASTPASSTWRKQLSRDDGGRRRGGLLLGEDHLRRRARRVRDDDRALALAAAGSREPGRVGLLPAVDDEDAVGPQSLPVALPAVLAEAGDGREQERQPGVEVAGFSTTSSLR